MKVHLCPVPFIQSEKDIGGPLLLSTVVHLFITRKKPFTLCFVCPSNYQSLLLQAKNLGFSANMSQEVKSPPASTDGMFSLRVMFDNF
ncbi:Hypothetical predicted protein [Olea europaea subsp. europaea]|uniref:Uncharacterized protein n=1 Tax=Olea europaea subsp. europaea TaxID=158383 RepID=A0A8S0UJQ4_OLEEU|nr:Hypothetical predicted protein [Olea europaea subsp. europaea]